MWKSVVAGTTALVIAGTALAVAQQPEGRADHGRRWQQRVDDMRAFGDARLAGLKAGLALTPEQEKNWPAFEQAAREIQAIRIDRLSTVAERRRSRSDVGNPAERLAKRADMLAETSTALKKLADATGPLYASLDEAQKRRFNVMAHDAHMRAFGAQRLRLRDGAPGMRHHWRTEFERGRQGPVRGLKTPLIHEESL